MRNRTKNGRQKPTGPAKGKEKFTFFQDEIEYGKERYQEEKTRETHGSANSRLTKL